MTGLPATRPRLLVVAGPNGAGKTTITERGLAHEWFHDCEYVNPDVIAQALKRAAKTATPLRTTAAPTAFGTTRGAAAAAAPAGYLPAATAAAPAGCLPAAAGSEAAKPLTHPAPHAQTR
jgi:hypothetical protein